MLKLTQEDDVDIEHIVYNSDNNLDEDKSSEEKEIINDNIYFILMLIKINLILIIILLIYIKICFI